MSNSGRVIVTGGKGFIGSRLIEHLITLGYPDIVSIDNESVPHPRTIPSGVTYIKADINDTDLIEPLFATPTAVVFHLAALISVAESMEKPDEYNHVNIEGTRSIVSLCEKYKVPKLVFASSCAVYGGSSKHSFNEESPTFPDTIYAKSKLEGEQLCLGLSPGIGIVARLSNVFGLHQDPERPYPGCIAAYVHAIKTGNPLEIHGSGDQHRDFVCVQDVVTALVELSQECSQSDIYNISRGSSISIRDLARLFQHTIVNKPSRPGAEHVRVQSKKIADLLKHPIERDDIRTQIQEELNIGFLLNDYTTRYLMWYA